MRRTYGLAAIGCLSLGLLVGCSSSVSTSDSASPTAAGSASAAPEKDATYTDVVALKDAAVAAGLECADFQETNDVPNSSQSGECGDTAVLAIYASTADQDKWLDSLAASSEEQVVLSGPNWTVKYADAKALQPMLGGVIVAQTGEATPSS